MVEKNIRIVLHNTFAIKAGHTDMDLAKWENCHCEWDEGKIRPSNRKKPSLRGDALPPKQSYMYKKAASPQNGSQ
jgi:hypothetical protein